MDSKEHSWKSSLLPSNTYRLPDLDLPRNSSAASDSFLQHHGHPRPWRLVGSDGGVDLPSDFIGTKVGKPAADLNKALPQLPRLYSDEGKYSASTRSRSVRAGSEESGSSASSVARKISRVPVSWKKYALQSARLSKENSREDARSGSEASTDENFHDSESHSARPWSLRAASESVLTASVVPNRRTGPGMASSEESKSDSSLRTVVRRTDSDDNVSPRKHSIMGRPGVAQFSSQKRPSFLRSISERSPGFFRAKAGTGERVEQPLYGNCDLQDSQRRVDTPASGRLASNARLPEEATALSPQSVPSSPSKIHNSTAEKGRLHSLSKQYLQRTFGRIKFSESPQDKTSKPESPPHLTDPTKVVLETVAIVLEDHGVSKSPATKSPVDASISKSSSIKSYLTFGGKSSAGSSKSTALSITSSLARAMMGKSPVNTPAPRDTYRGSDSNEYFKVQMTDANSPSFLPSEAIRISTPTLPGQRHRANDRRGFFFDYVAPEEPGSPSKKKTRPSPLQQGSTPSEQPEEDDWFRKQINVILNQQERAQFDLNVPEHLPGSPLCPLSPKHTSGGRGICVYHGRGGKGADCEDFGR